MAPERITVVIPCFNEEAFLPATLASLWADSQHGIEVTHLLRPIPGQVHALAMGTAAVETDHLAICDADTVYPPHCLETAVRLLRRRSWKQRRSRTQGTPTQG